jgi:hypothetical protein
VFGWLIEWWLLGLAFDESHHSAHSTETNLNTLQRPNSHLDTRSEVRNSPQSTFSRCCLRLAFAFAFAFVFVFLFCLSLTMAAF